MTYPTTLPTSPAVGDPIPASQADLIAQGMTYLSTFGEVGVGTNASAASVGATSTALVTVSFSALTGRAYRVSASISAQQMTASGFVNVTLSVSGAGANIVGGTSLLLVPAVANQFLVGSTVVRLTAASSGTVTVKMQASTGGGTLSVGASSSLVIVEDMGT